jgi:hypothetical protein
MCTFSSVDSGDAIVVLTEITYSSGTLPFAVATDEYGNVLNNTTWPSNGYAFWNTAPYKASDTITVDISSPSNMVIYCYDIRNAAVTPTFEFGSGSGQSVSTSSQMDPSYDYAVMAIMKAWSNATNFISGPGFILQSTGTIPNGYSTFVSGEYVASTASSTSCPSSLVARDDWSVMCVGLPPY